MREPQRLTGIENNYVGTLETALRIAINSAATLVTSALGELSGRAPMAMVHLLLELSAPGSAAACPTYFSRPRLPGAMAASVYALEFADRPCAFALRWKVLRSRPILPRVLGSSLLHSGHRHWLLPACGPDHGERAGCDATTDKHRTWRRLFGLSLFVVVHFTWQDVRAGLPAQLSAESVLWGVHYHQSERQAALVRYSRRVDHAKDQRCKMWSGKTSK